MGFAYINEIEKTNVKSKTILALNILYLNERSLFE